MRILAVGSAVIAGLALAGWAGFRLWPRTIETGPPAMFTPVWERVGDRDLVRLRSTVPVAEIGLYHDELYAYLMLQYLRGSAALSSAEVLLTYREVGDRILYPIHIRLENDLIAAVPLLANGREKGLFDEYTLRYLDYDALRELQYQTQVFVTAYSLTSRPKLEQMKRSELAGYLRRFVQFKSSVDPRIRRRLEPVPRPLNNEEARRLAADIVAVADFFSIPVDYFLGIGAMENNYINVKGDLQHAVWKRRADKGDIVVKRRRGRVLVMNPSSGPWQITRETLRYIHGEYLKDTRDYSALPEHLRPPLELNLDEPDPVVLTTYAGLLFRELLDRFEGDVAAAVGAYNGGPANPNWSYEAGARAAARHARDVLEQAAALNGRPAAGMHFFAAARDPRQPDSTARNR